MPAVRTSRAVGEGRPGEEGEPDREADQGDDRGSDEEPLDRVALMLAGPVGRVAHAAVPGGAARAGLPEPPGPISRPRIQEASRRMPQ